MIPNTITASTGIATQNINAHLTSIVNAIIIAPNTINGERRKSLITILTHDCTALTSLVIRFISLAVPISSISENDNVWICSKRECLSSVAKPVAAFAAKYCAVNELASPTSPSPIIIRALVAIYPISPSLIPMSMIWATTSGIISSKDASSNLKNGPIIVSFR